MDSIANFGVYIIFCEYWVVTLPGYFFMSHLQRLVYLCGTCVHYTWLLTSGLSLLLISVAFFPLSLLSCFLCSLSQWSLVTLPHFAPFHAEA
jgi:hypothetical protein